MIDIQEARMLSKLYEKNFAYSLPEWLEEIIDNRIREDAQNGKLSSRVCLYETEGLSGEEVAAVMSAYADFCPEYSFGEDEAIFDFSWGNNRRIHL